MIDLTNCQTSPNASVRIFSHRNDMTLRATLAVSISLATSVVGGGIGIERAYDGLSISSTGLRSLESPAALTLRQCAVSVLSDVQTRKRFATDALGDVFVRRTARAGCN